MLKNPNFFFFFRMASWAGRKLFSTLPESGAKVNEQLCKNCHKINLILISKFNEILIQNNKVYFLA